MTDLGSWIYVSVQTYCRQEAENQKERKFVCFVTGSTAFLAFADKHSFHSIQNRKGFYTFICVCLLVLTKNPENHRLFSARARAAFRNAHFFSPQSVAQLSAYRRVFVLFCQRFLQKSGFGACFFPYNFLVEAGKTLSVKKQRESRTACWLTRPNFLGARESPPTCICQAKSAFR